jgi:polyhydroxybutyrate depolymerase
MTVTARILFNGLFLLGLTSLGLGACGSSSGSGGGSGGTTGAGGSATSTGGATSSGGTVGSGGSSSGGTVGSGGSSSGGTVGTGGSSAGGTVGTGGSSSGGTVGTGGSSVGGKVGTGGSSAGGKVGTGGSSSGGTVGTGGSPGTAGTAGGTSSAGCGSTNTTSPCSKSGTTCSMDVGGTTRVYYVQLPSTYSPTMPYPVVFQFHPLGGSAEQALNEYRISTGLPNAIYVTPQGLTDSSGNAGWANTGGVDITFTKQMLSTVQSTYCVDNSRIFSVGFSYGGMMSFAVGCELSDTFRAIAPMSGALYSDFNCKGTGHPIAMFGTHGLNDTTVPIADGEAARNKILQQNHCGTTTVPNSVDASCVDYQGCDAGYPVTWCEFNGTHMPPSFGTSAITAFFKSF